MYMSTIQILCDNLVANLITIISGFCFVKLNMYINKIENSFKNLPNLFKSIR